MVGAPDFVLSEDHKSILFGYLESWYVSALQIETNTQEIKKNENVIITVTDEIDIPVVNATIFIGEDEYSTNELGMANITLSETGTHSIFAEKDQYIRSEKIEIQVQKSKMKGLDCIFQLFQETYIWNLLEMMIHNFF